MRSDALVPLIGAPAKPTEREHVSQAAERTAMALRQIAISPQINPQDAPVLLMQALGWDEFSRQILREVH